MIPGSVFSSAPRLTFDVSPTITAMLKYIKNYADSIKGIDVYPIISLFIFVLFFIAVIYYVRKMDKRRVEEMKNMPLDLDAETTLPLHTVKQA